MATSSAVPDALGRVAEVHDEWAADLSRWAWRVGARAAQFAAVQSAAQQVGALGGRMSGHAAWTRSVVTAFQAADLLFARAARVLRPDVWLPPLAMSDIASRGALIAEVLRADGGRRKNLLALLNNTDGRYLRIDPVGAGRVVEVLGDLASAKHVVVLVPGMSNDIGDYRTNLRTKATNVLSAMQAESDAAVAVISWLGYDPPGIKAAPYSGVAIAGADQLIEDVAAIRNSFPAVHVTVVGHSYGSVVLGEAMQTGLDAPTAIAVGSPGMDVDNRRQLGSPNTTLWAAKATFGIKAVPIMIFGHELPVVRDAKVRMLDPVSSLPSHGGDPTDEDFGARRFGVGDVSGHSEYFDPGTVSLQNIARIAVSERPI